MSGVHINEENAARLREWLEAVPEQARRAVETTGPSLAAAFESMRRAFQTTTAAPEDET